ncbi:MAG TPA: tetratricopeptide repeat protein [Terracidiphilus sp.]|nr:tetratricopeptide repeat protein [Terracidiphilus sp.]
MNRIDTILLGAGACAIAGFATLSILRQAGLVVHAQESAPAITIDYPISGSIFPPEITPPTFLWHDPSPVDAHWNIEIRFADGSAPMHFQSEGPQVKIGEIDPRCVSPTNELPKLTPQLATAHTWTPDAAAWERIKKLSVAGPATVIISGLNAGHASASSAQTSISTSTDPVGAPIFYRDVPLMPSETVKGIIKPLAENAVPLIEWRLRSISQPKSRVVLQGIHTCANCHSFSLDGKTMGMDMDGPRNDKGLYALVRIRPQMAIRNEDMVNWNPTGQHQFASNRVAFMSQVSPDGKHVLTMVTPADKPAENNYFVANFKDYRFLQVFYPTRGILAWYDRATGERHPLPGADNPEYVQTDGVWSPDGKYVVFARAKARDPYPPDGHMAMRANDRNELPMQYDLYRVPFNEGRGGTAEPIAGASANGMSNSFPKISPDGRWIVFVQCRNGQLMRPDSQLYILPAQGGVPRRLNANMAPMNSWHSWSPNSRWLVFSSKSRGPYTKMYLTHIDAKGNDSPAILVDNATAANRAVNIPEFVNIPADGIMTIATPAVEMYKQFDRATELGEKGEDAAAISAWKALAAEHADDARVHDNLGLEMARTGKYQDAISEYKRALALNPVFSAVHGQLATALVKMGRTGDALPEFEAALETAPALPDLHNSYGSALAQTGRVREAAEEFETALRLNPKYAEAHNNLGIVLAREGSLEDAIEHFSKAIALNPRFAEAHNNLGIALLSDAQPDALRAEQEFKTAIEVDPRYADAETNLGTLYRQEGNDAQAEQLFRRAVESNSRFVRAYVSLAGELLSESKMAEAIAVLEKALRIDPNNREARSLLASIKSHRAQ